MSLRSPGLNGQTFLNLDSFKLLASARSQTSANTHLASIYHLMPSMHIVYRLLGIVARKVPRWW